MEIRQELLPNYCYSNKDRDSTDLIVVHHISGINKFKSPAGVVDMEKAYNLDECREVLHEICEPDENGVRDGYASAHFMIGRAGKIIQLVPIEKKAWHAGVSRWGLRTNCNTFSIGIELVGSYLDEYTSEQYASLKDLCAYLMVEYKLSFDQITGHRNIAPGRKFDPNKSFDWEDMRQALGYINKDMG